MSDYRIPDQQVPSDEDLLNLDEFPEHLPGILELPAEKEVAAGESAASPVSPEETELPEEPEAEQAEQQAPPEKAPARLLGWTFKKVAGKAAEVQVAEAPADDTQPEEQTAKPEDETEPEPAAEEEAAAPAEEQKPEQEPEPGDEQLFAMWNRRAEEQAAKEQEQQPQEPTGQAVAPGGLQGLLSRVKGLPDRLKGVFFKQQPEQDPDQPDGPQLHLVEEEDPELAGLGDPDQDPRDKNPFFGLFRREPQPDIPPRTLSILYGNLLGRRMLFLILAIPVVLVMVYLNVSDGLNLPVPEFMWEDACLTAVMLELLGVEVLLLAHTMLRGFKDLFFGRFGMHILASFAVVFTAADCMVKIYTDRPGPLPCVAATGLVLYFCSLGQYFEQKAMRVSCRAASMIDQPSRLSLFRMNGQTTDMLLKFRGDSAGFGSQIQDGDGIQRRTAVFSLLVLVATVMIAVTSSLGQGEEQLLCWIGSVILTLSTPLGATISYSMAWSRSAERLNPAGAALAGWDGVVELKEARQLAITDDDLFPTGMIVCNGIQSYGKVSMPLTVGYAATLAKEGGGGLGDTFDKLLYSQGAKCWNDVLGDFVRYEGGYGGCVGKDRILLGTADFMKKQGITLPEGISVRTAIFCAINGELAAQFATIYKMPTYVQPAIQALTRAKYRLALAVKDFNLNPQVLVRSFNLPMDKMAYPYLSTRLELSEPADPDATLGAVLAREGLDSHCDVVLQARMLYKIGRKNSRWLIAAMAAGLFLGTYLTGCRAYTSLQPGTILIYVLLWLVPCLLNSYKINHV